MTWFTEWQLRLVAQGDGGVNLYCIFTARVAYYAFWLLSIYPPDMINPHP